jgi:SET domain-containing protein
LTDLEQPAETLDSVATTDPVAPPETDLEAVDTELETQPTEDPDEEDEIEGVKLRGKKEALERIKAERLMQADYTRKTQEVAEQRRTIEA